MSIKKQTLLWQIEGESLAGTSFLFGTMHVRDQLAFQRMAFLYPFIDACPALATEFKLDEAETVHMGSLFSSQSPPLDQYFRPKVYQKMRKILKKVLDIELNRLRHLSPFLILNMLNEQLLAKDMPVSLDEHLSTYAKSKDKLLLGVETFQEQAKVLQKIPMDYQFKALRAMLSHFAKHRKQLLHTADLYAAGDPVKIYKATRKGAGALRKLLLFDRNVVMADRIFEVCQSQPTFIAIGAGHLAGGKGVLRFLKLKGLQLNPIALITKDA